MKKWSVVKLLSSTVVWILIILAVVDVFLVRVRPLQYVTDLRFIPLDQHPMVSKIPVFLESRDRTNLLVLGSSLPMCAIAEYDEKCYGEPHCKVGFELRRYLGARYLEEQLTKGKGYKLKVSNMSVVSCMASDMYIILSHCIRSGKKPDTVLLCIAPRDFVDNSVQPIGRTPPFELLQGWKSLNDLVRPGLSTSEKRALIISSFWYFYRVKVDYRTIITQYCASLLAHPTSLYYSSRLGTADQPVTYIEEHPTTLDGYNKLYERRYKPPNSHRFAQELEYFQKLLDLCLQERIQCIVINMPVSASHQALLDAKLSRQYALDTKTACAVAGASFFDFNDQDFSNQDFSDGFHLNSIGAGKFQKRLIQNLLSNHENEKSATRN